jgi:phage minor structural protein
LFIDVDYKKRLKGAKFHLARPNRIPIDVIHERFEESISVKLGNIGELSFSIPYEIEDANTGEYITNPQIHSIKELMLIRVTMESFEEWYVVSEIKEDSDDDEVFNVTAFSLGYELRRKKITGIEEESINLTQLMTMLLSETVWKIGTIDPMFDAMFRSFESGDNTNILDCITQAIETFGALIIWDTINKTISFKDATKNGKFRGMIVKDGQFLNTVSRTRSTDEMVTRFHMEGSEGLTIHSVNPTGMGYVENFDYFMHPFKRDANKNVIQSSYYMSDALCHALLDQQSLLFANAPRIKTLSDTLIAKQTELITEQSKLDELNNQLKNLEGLLDTAKGTEDKKAITDRTNDINTKKGQIATQEQVVNLIKVAMANAELELETLQNQISHEANFTPQLVEELDSYILDDTWIDDNYTTAKDLYEEGLKKFEEIRKPKVVIEIEIENLLNIIEEQYYWDKIVIGDLIKVKYPRMNIEYMAKIIEITFNLEEQTATLTVANNADLLNDTEKLVQLLNQTSNAVSLVTANKYKWDKINAVQKEVSSILTSEWDATKNKITAGVNNSVEVGRRGIIIKNPDFPQEVVIMQSGVIALSMDGGETWKTAIKPDGIVAERLIGQIIAGQELLITNSSGSFTLDNNGAKFNVNSFIIESGNGTNVVEKWQSASEFIDEFKDDGIITPYEKKMLKIEFDKIIDKYNAYQVKIDTYFPDHNGAYQFINNYVSAYQALYDYLFVELQGDKPLLASTNMAYSTRVDSAVYASKFKSYETSETELDKQITIKFKNQLQDLKDQTQSDIEEVMNDVAYSISLFSTNGLIFKNGNVQTDIIATVYKGTQDITSTLSNSQFIWKKFNEGLVDIAWNTAHANVGNRITVTKADVYKTADFQCFIDIP